MHHSYFYCLRVKPFCPLLGRKTPTVRLVSKAELVDIVPTIGLYLVEE